MNIVDFKFPSGSSYPLEPGKTLVLYTRYVHGAIIATPLDDILEIIPNNKRNGGHIIFKREIRPGVFWDTNPTDIYYTITTLTNSCDKPKKPIILKQ